MTKGVRNATIIRKKTVKYGYTKKDQGKMFQFLKTEQNEKKIEEEEEPLS